MAFLHERFLFSHIHPEMVLAVTGAKFFSWELGLLILIVKDKVHR
jgi:hypothetical protein